VSEPSAPQPSSSGVGAALKQLGKAGVAVSEGSGATLILYLLVLVFLAIQDRIDRNDPKLALAPVYAEPMLSFEPLTKRAM
jgi:hypothetical protein